MIREIILEINDEEITDRVLLKVLDEQFDAYGRLHDDKGQLTKIMLKAQNSDINLFTKQEEKKLKRILKKYSGYLAVHHYINCDEIEIELPEDADLSDNEEFFIEDLEYEIDSFKPDSIDKDWLKRVTGFDDDYIGDDIHEEDDNPAIGPYTNLI